MNTVCGIYKITNTVTGDFYIGSASNIQTRLCNHRWHLSNLKHGNRHLQNSWNKHGADNFKFSIVLLCDIENKLYYEQAIIDGLKPAYNIAVNVTASMQGLHHTEETKLKIGVSHKGERNYLFGKHLSEERKRKISESQKGRCRSEETKCKISMSEKNKVVSEESKRRMSVAQKGRYFSEETKQKMSVAGGNRLGCKHTDEARAKMSEAKKGKPNGFLGKHHTEETRAKIRETLKRRQK